MSLLQGKIDVTKFVKDKFFKGKNGTYASISVSELRTPDKYGNTHIITQDLGKEIRDKRERFHIVGNLKVWDPEGRSDEQHRSNYVAREVHGNDEFKPRDDIPF